MSRHAAQPGEMDAAVIRSSLDAACPGALPHWLETRRWFADKGRNIREVAIEDALIEQVGHDWLSLTVVRITFAEGDPARYLLPLALTNSPGDAGIVGRLTTGAAIGPIVDATETPWFGGWLLEQLTGTTELARGAWIFCAEPGAAEVVAAARNSPPAVMRAEQSNSSLRFGDIMIVKLFRRLQPGLNPDEEVLRALAGVSFERVPRFVGSITWRSLQGATFAVALAQGFVPNLGDGWSWMLERLAGVARGSADLATDRFTPERLLGQRTGELHVAIGAVRDPEFAPEPTDSGTIDANVRRSRAAIEETIALLRDRESHLPGDLTARLPTLIAGLRALDALVAGYSNELDSWRIRVHGDYHLGQTLRSPQGDWVVIDFEGEPARSLEERRQRTSALKDVAGMLRSFAYARGVAEREADGSPEQTMRSRLEAWEKGARHAFLEGYRRALTAAEQRLVPEDDAAFDGALAAWELDKALYEVAYEVRNRPGWLELPLRSLLPDLLDQATDSAGGVPA